MPITKSLKRFVKRSLQYAAASFGPHRRPAKSPQLLVLMYHRVLPSSDDRAQLEEPGMVVTPETFRNHLLTISEYFEIVSLSNWLERKKQSLPLPSKACAITFDDGWSDNYQYAFPILQEMQVQATIFVVAEMIGTDKQFWPERLANLAYSITKLAPDKWSIPELSWLKSAKTDFDFGKTPPSSEQITQLVSHAKSFTDAKIHSLIDEAEKTLGVRDKKNHASLLNWSEIENMISSGYVEIGSHTCHHTRLNNMVSDEIIYREIHESKTIIHANTKKEVKLFCFPNGDYSESALRYVKENYIGSVTTLRGWNNSQTDDYLLKRVGIFEDVSHDTTSFLGRVSCWF